MQYVLGALLFCLAAQASLDTFCRSLYKNPKDLPSVSIPSAFAGNLQKKSQFSAELHHGNAVEAIRNWADSINLRIGKIHVEKMKPGKSLNTLGVFKVSGELSNARYLVKLVNNEREPNELLKQKSLLLFHPECVSNLMAASMPHFVVPILVEKILSKEQDIYVMLFPFVNISDFESIFRQAMSGKLDKNISKKAFFDAGKSLSAFGFSFSDEGNMYVHKDFHHKNLIYDASTGVSYFVDNSDISFQSKSLMDFQSFFDWDINERNALVSMIDWGNVLSWVRHPSVEDFRELSEYKRIKLLSDFFMEFSRGYLLNTPENLKNWVKESLAKLCLSYQNRVEKHATADGKVTLDDIFQIKISDNWKRCIKRDFN
ncbi:MAG: hypothetical protein WCK49_00325 [Myxococcaceae bacterium]